MKKVYLLIAVVFVCLTSLSQTPYVSKVMFEYPFKQGSSEWNQFKNSTERIAALQIPQNIITQLPTEDLLEICLEFPYLSDVFAFDNFDMGFKAMSAKFNGFGELFKRADLVTVLLKHYEKIPEKISRTPNCHEEWGNFSFQTYVLTYMLGLDEVYDNMDESQLHTLVNTTTYNLEQMEKRTELQGTLGFRAVKQMQENIRLTRNQIELSEGNIYHWGNNRDYLVTTKETPNGSSVIAGELINPDMTESEKAQLRFIAENNYGAMFVSEATNRYNCHAYAWHISEGHSNDYVWIGLGANYHENIYWEDGSYIEVPEAIATKISYDEETANHSAMRYDSHRYISKWGAWPLVIHLPNEVPYNTSRPKKFYIRHPQLLGSSSICNMEIFNLENFPTGCTVNWSVSNNCAQIVSGQGTESVTLQRNYDGWTTLTATISHNGTVIKTLSKEIMVGTPSPSMVVYPISADGEWGYWRSDLHGNKIEVDGYSGNYSSYVVDLYRINNDFSIGQQVGHWTRNSLDNMTFGYYPPGWYYIEIVGVNDCGTSSPVGTEIESVDGSWRQPRMFSFNYHQGSEMLTVTQNPALGSRQAVNSCEIQLWNGNTMLRKFRMTDEKLQIPMSGMKSGLYIVRAITDDGKSQQHKLMKK